VFCLLLPLRWRWIMMTLIESVYVMYLSALKMRSDWFFPVFNPFWQIIHCSLQTKTNKKAVLWQGYVSKFTAASRGSPCDSTAFLLFLVFRDRGLHYTGSWPVSMASTCIRPMQLSNKIFQFWSRAVQVSCGIWTVFCAKNKLAHESM